MYHINEADLCKRCQGAGMLVCYDYWKGGICFGCNGTGWAKKKQVKKPASRLEFVVASGNEWIGF